MEHLEDRADALLRSPVGCAFLLAAEAASMSPEEFASPRNSFYLCAYAVMDALPWQRDLYPRVHGELLRQGQRLRDLALAMLRHPAAERWFGPLDTYRQVYIPSEMQPPDPALFSLPADPLTDRRLHARQTEKPLTGMRTSTLVHGTSSAFVGHDTTIAELAIYDIEGARYFQRHQPYANWLVRADPSSRVYEVDGPQAWHDLCVRYPAEGISERRFPDFTGETGRLIPDWSAIAADWDAVHLTFGGLLTATQVRVESAAGWTYLWSWPIEETQWLHWKFTHVERMPDHDPPRWRPFQGRFHPRFIFRAGLVEDEPPMTPDEARREFPDPLPARQWMPSVARLKRLTAEFPDPLPPPPEPPDVFLMRHGSEYERQQAMLVLSQWTGDGVPVTNSLAGSPIQRPAPLNASGTDIVIVRIATESAPSMLNVRHFDKLKPDGHVTGTYVSLAAWLHPRVFSNGAQQNSRLAKYNADADPPGWEFAVRLPETVSESHIVLWAQWESFTASWTISITR